MRADSSVRREHRTGPFRIVQSHYGPSFVSSKHAHDSLLVYVIRTGQLEEFVGSTTLSCDAGTVVVMPPDVEHIDRYGPGGGENFVVSIDRRDVIRLGGDTAIREPMACTSPSLREAVELMRAEAQIDDPDSVLAIEALIIEILLNHQTTIAQKAARPAWLRDALSRIHDAPEEQVTLAELAEFAGVHPVHVATAFRRRIGCTVGAYRRRVRLSRAMRMLRQDRATVAEIAAACGFADQSHFCRVFRLLTGYPPSAHRERLSRPTLNSIQAF